ncbi:MAG: mercury(II) reductase [Geobacteraceae bacterium]|nr:mercury(II) reductase [Geobacteraceae bacterium]
MPTDCDIIILGSGSTAFAAALRARTLGFKVTMIEKSAPGGTCINWGCIPSKTLIHSALFRQEAHLGELLGVGTVTDGIDWEHLTNHKNKVVKGLRKTKYLDVLQEVPGLSLIKGTGKFIGPQTLEVGEQVLRSDRILVATGGFPLIPALPGLDRVDYLTSRSALLLKKFPSSLIIIGGGVIAVELGQMFTRMGTKVRVLEHGTRILSHVETEPVQAVQTALQKEGMKFFPDVKVQEITQTGNTVEVIAESDGRRKTFRAEKLLVAAGTAPASTGIGLEKVGVKVDGRGFVTVDDQMRTTAPGIWAAGDVTGGMMIATVGAREGIVAVDNMLTPDCSCRIDYSSLPMAIFTDPEIGTVGYTEESARKAGYQVTTNTIPVSAIPKAQVTGHTAGAIKMVAEEGSGRLLGVHLSCHRGADIINEAALAIRCRITVSDLANMTHVYPSMAEGLRLCAQGFTRNISRLSCCAE